jgi:hypothetical protein
VPYLLSFPYCFAPKYSDELEFLRNVKVTVFANVARCYVFMYLKLRTEAAGYPLTNVCLSERFSYGYVRGRGNILERVLTRLWPLSLCYLYIKVYRSLLHIF